LKEKYKGREDKEEELSSYWITLRKREVERGSSRLHMMEDSL
jgi:hypothetical protein